MHSITAQIHWQEACVAAARELSVWSSRTFQTYFSLRFPEKLKIRVLNTGIVLFFVILMMTVKRKKVTLMFYLKNKSMGLFLFLLALPRRISWIRSIWVSLL